MDDVFDQREALYAARNEQAAQQLGQLSANAQNVFVPFPQTYGPPPTQPRTLSIIGGTLHVSAALRTPDETKRLIDELYKLADIAFAPQAK
jgi:hypothetical protein